MSNEAVKWAMDDAPMLLTEKGKPDTTARAVLWALAEHAHKDGRNAHPSNLRIRYRTGYDERTVRRALRRLEEGGLIKADGAVNGRTRWVLALDVIRPETDWSALEAEEDRLRQAVAERVRRHRAKRVTDSAPVTETASVSVTDTDVTDSAPVSNAIEVRYTADVTHSESVRNALSAPLTTRNHPTTEPPDNHPPTPLPNLPAVRATAEVDNSRPDWLVQLQNAMSASGIDVPWKFVGDEQLLLQNDVQRLGIPRMIRFAVDAKAGAARPPFSSRWFYPGWRGIPTPVDPNVVALQQPKSRQQQETDDMFDRAMARAKARREARETS